MSTMTIPHAEQSNILAGFRLVLAVWVERQRRRRQLISLLDQPDYILEDVGLDRRDVLQEASKPFWKN